MLVKELLITMKSKYVKNRVRVLILISITLLLSACTKVSERINNTTEDTSVSNEVSLEESVKDKENLALKKKNETVKSIESDTQTAKDSISEAVDYICNNNENIKNEEFTLELIYYSAYLTDLSYILIDEETAKSIDSEYGNNAIVKLAKLSHNYYINSVFQNKTDSQEAYTKLNSLINDIKNNYEVDLEEFIEILKNVSI